MDLTAIIEVAIGMILVWIVISLSTIQLQEWIVTGIFKKRSKDLEKSIQTMLVNPNLKAQLYDHPIIRGITAKKKSLPSYIPAQQFALSIFDIAMTAGTESSLIQRELYSFRNDLEQAKQKDKREAALAALENLTSFARSAAASEAGTAVTNAGIVELKKRVRAFAEQHGYPKDVDGFLKNIEDQKKAMDAFLPPPQTETPSGGADASTGQTANGSDPALVQLRRGIAALSAISPELNQNLNALLQNVENYATKEETKMGLARKNVEKWFDDSMDRLNGAFKRYSQWWAFGIGLVLALAMNVDSINLITYLWRDPSVRQVLADRATSFQLPPADIQANPSKAMQDFTDQFSGLNLPIGWTLKEKNDPLFTTADNSNDFSACTPSPTGNDYFGIPFYKYQLTQGFAWTKDKCLTPAQPDHFTTIWLKILGIILTALAAAQGAPFWFDILKKLINVRGTGANPAEKAAG